MNPLKLHLRALLFTLFCFSFSSVKAQDLYAKRGAAMLWQKCLGGSSNDVAVKMIVTNDGGTLVAGTTTSTNGNVTGNHGGGDIWIVKTSAAGDIEWQKCIGGSLYETPTNIIQTTDGGCMVTGITNSTDGDFTGNHGSTDGTVFKLSATGTLQWSTCYGGSQADSLSSIFSLPGGGFLLFGNTRSNNGNVSGNHGGSDTWVVKIDNAGAILWQRCYGGSNDDNNVMLTLFGNNGFAFCAITTSNDGDVSGNTNNKTAWCVRADNDGNIIWQKTLGTDNKDFPLGITDNVLSNISVIYGRMDYFPIDLSGTIRYRLHMMQKRDMLNEASGATISSSAINLTPTNHQSIGVYEARFRGYANSNPSVLSNGYKCGLQGFDGPPYILLNKGVSLTSNIANYLENWRNCPSNPSTTLFHFRGYDVDRTDDGREIMCGTTNDDQFGLYPATQNYDAYLSTAPGSSFNAGVLTLWGGSNNDGFTIVNKVNNNTYYACGYTLSNNGFVSGNHGGQEIWLVKIGLKSNLNEIKGTVYVDRNNNNTRDAGDINFTRGVVNSQKSNQQVTSFPDNGRFSNFVDTGTYLSTLSLNFPYNNYYTVSPSSKSSVFQDNNFILKDSFDFSLKPIPGKKDLMAVVSMLTPSRAGFDATYLVHYENAGTEVMANTRLQFIKDSRTAFVSSTMPGYIISGDTISWNTGSLSPLYENNFKVILHISGLPQVNLGDTLVTTVQVDPALGDETPADNKFNHTAIVTGAYDPNDKHNQHGNRVSTSYLQENGFIYYLVRFQNTGTDTAFNIKITDTLSADINRQTLEFVSASHPYRLTPGGNNSITVDFPYILLPPAAANIDGSQGYFLFRARPLAGAIVPERLITNRAAIYFDVNPAIITNNDTLIIKAIVSRPLLGNLAGGYCKDGAVLQSGKLLNPSSFYNISIKLDEQTLVYNSLDSSFSFNPGNLISGAHSIKVIYSIPGSNPDSTTHHFVVDSVIIPVITNSDLFVCKNDPSVILQANTTVSWSGNGVSGSTFNPAAAGVGVHQIIATKTNGACPASKDTLTITVDDFVQAVISTPDQTVCRLSSSISLNANTSVSWSGNGVSGSTFNPATAGVGTHLIVATKTNGTCPASKDTLTITVDDFVQAVISTPDQTVCRLSSPISLLANTSVAWTGNGVSGSIFNPAVAGVGVHQIIATKTNGTCPDSKDTLNITVEDFVQAVISTPDQTICKLSSPISLSANTSVVWTGNGVSGSSFNPAVAGAGVHQIFATKTNGTCPDSKDTLNITVEDFVQAVISTPDQTICRLSSPINLNANTTVNWSGNGVSGSTFNPAVAGAGVHQIIATKTNGACPVSKDTLTITVTDFIRPVIGNNDTTVCILNGSFGLRADIPVTWSGNGVSGSIFNPSTSGAGTHLVIASRSNGVCPVGKDTLVVIVQPALTPDVNLTASQNTIGNATQTSLLTAVNAAAGGTAPLYTFAKDRNFTQLLQAESASNTFMVTPQLLSMGTNTLYVRMRSNASCLTATTALDSVTITLNVATAPKSELEKALKVFPNPNSGLFSFRFETGINDAVSVTIFDGAGKQVYSEGFGAVSQYYFGRTLDLRNQADGIYSMLFKIGNISFIKRVNIAR